MLKKHLNPIIAVASFIIAITGIINNAFFPTHDFAVMRYKDLANPFYLDWIFSGSSLRYNGLNYVNAIVDGILLLGAIAFVASGYKRTRLIRFVFSIIFLSNALIFVNLILLFIFKSYFTIWLQDIFTHLLYYLLDVFWIVVALKVLNHLKSQKALQQEVVNDGEHPQSYYVKAAIGYRILHPLVDMLVTIAVFSEILGRFVDYGSGALFRFMTQTPESWAQKNITLVIIALRILYYIICESVLGSSPAKFLTKTRVIDYDGNKPSVKKVIIRTLCRLIPFEGFSFFANDGWHDKISETTVVKEE
ncbi:RDD family protein [Mucilaginibacter sp. SMC90]|uniref:RDD family protein n=1 Tax=Mucilaginibacter sp. SMC90 TaxID=2929803 RepID=UPI001FB4EAD1|nr:RDD family protein [Mucilaginibacter sp. SMC90]UOE48240.1 RDD family protein [Mucilaginibacter sp. SMC90]